MTCRVFVSSGFFEVAGTHDAVLDQWREAREQGDAMVTLRNVAPGHEGPVTIFRQHVLAVLEIEEP